MWPAPQTSALQLSARPTNAGSDGSFGPRNLAAIEPIDGYPAPSRPSSVRRASGLPACIVIGVWLLAVQSTERMTVSLSAMAACLGKCSQNRTPGTRVAVVPKGPRTSPGASGLGSHMSRWLGPPESQKTMTDFGPPFRLVPPQAAAASAWRRINWAADNPATPESPARKNHRRDSEPTPRMSRAGGPHAL